MKRKIYQFTVNVGIDVTKYLRKFSFVRLLVLNSQHSSNPTNLFQSAW